MGTWVVKIKGTLSLFCLSYGSFFFFSHKQPAQGAKTRHWINGPPRTPLDVYDKVMKGKTYGCSAAPDRAHYVLAEVTAVECGGEVWVGVVVEAWLVGGVSGEAC